MLAIGAAASLAGHLEDPAVNRSLSGSRLFDRALGPGHVIGGMRAQLGMAAATLTLGRLASSPRVGQLGSDLLRAQLMAQTLTIAGKVAVRRTRPDGTQFSFPSGHASTSFATATVLQRDLGWKFGAPAYAVASYVAASRIQDRRHNLSDVIFGAAVGMVAGRTVTVGHGDTRFAVSPAAVPRGAAVTFTLLGKH